MSRLSHTLYEIQTIDEMARLDRWINRIHPLVKLCLTLFYMILVVSFEPGNLIGLLGMFVYPFLLFGLGDISIKDALFKLRIILPLVCIIGLFNPFFDRKPVAVFAGIFITRGMISFCTLLLKGVFTILSSYLLIATTTIEDLCYALRLLHLPKLFVTQILLIHRYLVVLLSEANRITQAYLLRAPKQTGIHYKVWGTLVGQLLLRSMDRATELYQSMCLRGYVGEFYYGNKKHLTRWDFLYFLIGGIIISLFRIFPVFEIVGRLFI